MPRALTLKGEREEELMEALALYDNIVEDYLDKIIGLLDQNEDGDHSNDKTRLQAVADIQGVLRSTSCNDIKAADNFAHGAMQKLIAQEIQDLRDDKPRVESRILLAELRQKSIHNSDTIKKLIERCRRVKK